MATNYLILDLETTGLADTDEILEIAAMVVDKDLNEIDRFETLVTPGPAIDRMNAFVTKMHTESGLIKDLSSKKTVDIETAEQGLVKFLQKNNLKPGAIVLTGHSPAALDKRMIQIYMPTLNWLLSHHLCDISGMFRFFRDFADMKSDEQTVAHRAMADVEMTLAEAKRIRDIGVLGGSPKSKEKAK